MKTSGYHGWEQPRAWGRWGQKGVCTLSPIKNNNDNASNTTTSKKTKENKKKKETPPAATSYCVFTRCQAKYNCFKYILSHLILTTTPR